MRGLLGFAARSQGDMVGARAWIEAARERYTETTDDVWSYYELGWIDMTEDAVDGALTHFRHGLALIVLQTALAGVGVPR